VDAVGRLVCCVPPRDRHPLRSRPGGRRHRAARARGLKAGTGRWRSARAAALRLPGGEVLHVDAERPGEPRTGRASGRSRSGSIGRRDPGAGGERPPAGKRGCQDRGARAPAQARRAARQASQRARLRATKASSLSSGEAAHTRSISAA
jgi:hypothetical protein